ncbi:MAG: F0F1 ATP synthase subunit B [Aestuariivirgaceae bacterium]
MSLFNNPEFWVAIAFFLLIGLFIYLKVPGKIITFLDERAAGIAKTLADAQKLREEAQALLSEYRGKRQQAEAEAAEIIAQARKEAEAYGAEARGKLKEMLERRSASAKQKIAQAEAAAVKEVRAATAELAVSVATRTLKEELKGPEGAKLIDRSIADLKHNHN